MKMWWFAIPLTVLVAAPVHGRDTETPPPEPVEAEPTGFAMGALTPTEAKDFFEGGALWKHAVGKMDEWTITLIGTADGGVCRLLATAEMPVPPGSTDDDAAQAIREITTRDLVEKYGPPVDTRRGLMTVWEFASPNPESDISEINLLVLPPSRPGRDVELIVSYKSDDQACNASVDAAIKAHEHEVPEREREAKR